MSFHKFKINPFVIFLFSLFLANCTPEEKKTSLEDYQRAEQFLSPFTHPLISGEVSQITWITDEVLIYQKSINNGHVFIQANLDTKEKKPAFDHGRLAKSLDLLLDTLYSEQNLPLSSLKKSSLQNGLTFSIGSKQYFTNLENYEIREIQPPFSRAEHVSPNGKWAAFIKDYNLWVRNLETGQSSPLTQDGKKDYGYATNNAGWIKKDLPVLLWSPRSDKIATFRHDGRGVGEMYLYNTKVGHSTLHSWKYPLPGDSNVFKIERIILDLNNPTSKLVRLKMESDFHRSTLTDHVADDDGTLLDAEWNEDGTSLAFVSSSRDHKKAHLQVADARTGVVRSILKEEVPTYFESGDDRVNWHVLDASKEVIWFSERDNWGHLYLYDLATGVLKHAITQGDWRVLQVVSIDQKNRIVYFLGSNREKGDPYFQYLYSIHLDGKDLTLLTPEIANHVLHWSPGNQYFIDQYSTPTTPPVTVVRDLNGKVIMPLEEVDLSSLVAHGWIPPEPFTVKARDEQTDLYGLLYKPSQFDPSQRYPILNYVYPGPQAGSVGSRSFMASRRDKQALAELGFIVVELDAMGTPGRSKSFHDAYYGNMGDNGIPDQMTAIQQLANRYSWMDIHRVGIWGHSGGGFASTSAILRYPDFYKVAVSSAGNHDNRNYEDDWGEKWQGLLRKHVLVKESEGETNYDNQANPLLAKNLKGKLLLAHGLMDDNVPPTNTLLVVDALISAGKDFDLLLIPNARHGFGNTRYFMKRRWDYFVRHLKKQEPPEGFIFSEKIP